MEPTGDLRSNSGTTENLVRGRAALKAQEKVLHKRHGVVAGSEAIATMLTPIACRNLKSQAKPVKKSLRSGRSGRQCLVTSSYEGKADAVNSLARIRRPQSAITSGADIDGPWRHVRKVPPEIAGRP